MISIGSDLVSRRRMYGVRFSTCRNFIRKCFWTFSNSFHVDLGKNVECRKHRMERERESVLWYLLWRKKVKMGITWVVWNHLTMRKCFGGADFCYCKICVHIHICGYLLSNISLRRVWHIGRKWLRHRGGNYLMELFLLKIPCSSCTQHLVVSWDMWLMLDLRGFWILLKHNHCYVSPQ